jgi:hypothetical protein
MSNKWVSIDQVKNWDKNPRGITKEEFERLVSQIKELSKIKGVENAQYKPLIVDQNLTVIGGNMRLRAYRSLGFEKVWVSQVECQNDQERLKIALSDNDQAGHTEADKLAELSLPYADSLKDFKVNLSKSTSINELLDRYRPSPEEIKPEIQFSEELYESQNYVVLYFNNDIDWLYLQSVYPLKTVKALDSKEGFEKMGVGRVVNGIEFIKKVRGEDQ